MTRPIPAALIGYGYVGETFHAPLIVAEPGLDLTVIGSRRPDAVALRHRDVRVIDDPLAAVTDPAIELVVIATPNDTHAPLAQAALAAGKHVVVDKPFTLTAEEARRLEETAAAHDRLLSVFHNRRWDSDFLTVAAAVKDGEIGEVMLVESRFDRFRPQVRDRWREAAVPGAGILYDLGPHLIDQLLCLFGLPDSLSAEVARQRPGARAEDWFQLVLRWGERRAILSAGMLVADPGPRWRVHGTGGTLVKACIDRQEDQLKAGMMPGAPDWGGDADPALVWTGEAPPRRLPARAGDYRRFYSGIVAALEGRGTPPVSAAQAMATAVILDAALRQDASAARFDWSDADHDAWQRPDVGR